MTFNLERIIKNVKNRIFDYLFHLFITRKFSSSFTHHVDNYKILFFLLIFSPLFFVLIPKIGYLSFLLFLVFLLIHTFSGILHIIEDYIFSATVRQFIIFLALQIAIFCLWNITINLGS